MNIALAPASELLDFMSVASALELSFFKVPALASVPFHTLIF